MTTPSRMDCRRIVLEKVWATLEHTLSLAWLDPTRDHLRADVRIDEAARTLAVRIRAYLVAGPGEVRVLEWLLLDEGGVP